jgi:hypothetical protein
MDVANPRCPLLLRTFQRLMAIDNEKRLQNQGRLRELVKSHGAEVRLFSAHDPSEFAALAGVAPHRAAA